jgi:DNA-binding MarR family transcriptional regulator
MSNTQNTPAASINNDLGDHELEVLEHIAGAQTVRQRDIARIIGVSLGMTNAILKRLARKGLITIRKVNNRNIMYAVSPAGFEEIALRSYRFLKRTIKNVVVYRETIESLVELVADQGFEEIVLIEESDLDFIVEHACDDLSLRYRRTGTTTPQAANGRQDPAGPNGVKVFLLHSEQLEPPSGRRSLGELETAILSGAREAYLSEVLI